MSDHSHLARRAFAAIGALALTVSLLVSSFATPQVAGAVALLAQAFPNLTGQEIVEILLDHQADPDAAIHTDQISEEYPGGFPESGLPLLFAMDKGHDDIAHLLLDRGARADAWGRDG